MLPLWALVTACSDSNWFCEMLAEDQRTKKQRSRLSDPATQFLLAIKDYHQSKDNWDPIWIWLFSYGGTKGRMPIETKANQN